MRLAASSSWTSDNEPPVKPLIRTINVAPMPGRQLAWFGMKDRFPSASDEELRLRIVIQRIGPDLAVRVYPAASAFIDR